MRSVADDLHRELHGRLRQLDPSERIDLALRLGDADVAALAEARGVTAAEARRIFARARRRPAAVTLARRRSLVATLLDDVATLLGEVIGIGLAADRDVDVVVGKFA